MICFYRNADGSFRSDPMIPRQLKKTTTVELNLTHSKMTISALFRFGIGGFLEGGEKLIAGQVFPCSISSDNELGSWQG